MSARRRPQPQPQGRRGPPDSSRTPPACRTARPGQPGPGSPPVPDAGAPSAPIGGPAAAPERTQRLVRRKLHPQRQRVDEQPHHALNAGNLRRPARHRNAEHHVVAAGQPAQQDRPRRLDVGVERQPPAARLLLQRRGQRRAQRQRDLLRQPAARAPTARPPAASAPRAPPKPPARPSTPQPDPAPQSSADNRGRASPAAATRHRPDCA